MASRITRRPGADSDREFLYVLLKRSLGPQIEATYGPWNEEWQREHFLATTDPGAHEIVECNGEAIGCLLIEAGQEAIQLHRIFLLPEYQNRGIGMSVMRQIVSDASAQGKPVKIQVFRTSPAVRFYERLGFRHVDQTKTHFTMEHTW